MIVLPAWYADAMVPTSAGAYVIFRHPEIFSRLKTEIQDLRARDLLDAAKCSFLPEIIMP